ncbi:hypothetical protein NPIL_295751 [Nephila pilipes]|uniref:Uncharacterized protein n=1 Tax=Nephila pilipes TaxID=299642 RepID=A0A8X6R0A4_NEPPI|nr:hypothetical protein NPIL_295751 [Nephila pilipes]
MEEWTSADDLAEASHGDKQEQQRKHTSTTVASKYNESHDLEKVRLKQFKKTLVRVMLEIVSLQADVMLERYLGKLLRD